MRVLRENKESIIAVLEAFSRDPLVKYATSYFSIALQANQSCSWRLVTGGRRIETAPVAPHQQNPQGHGGAAETKPGDVYRRPKADESNQFDGESSLLIWDVSLTILQTRRQRF
jgi:hypothetical protein